MLKCSPQCCRDISYIIGDVVSIHRRQSNMVLFQAPHTAPPTALKERRKTQKQLRVKFIKNTSVMSAGSYYAHTCTSGQDTSLEHTKRSYSIQRHSALSINGELPGRLCYWRPELGFYTLWFDKALTQQQAECRWPSKQSRSLKLHKFLPYHIPTCSRQTEDHCNNTNQTLKKGLAMPEGSISDAGKYSMSR